MTELTTSGFEVCDDVIADSDILDGSTKRVNFKDTTICNRNKTARTRHGPHTPAQMRVLAY